MGNTLGASKYFYVYRSSIHFDAPECITLTHSFLLLSQCSIRCSRWSCPNASTAQMPITVPRLKFYKLRCVGIIGSTSSHLKTLMGIGRMTKNDLFCLSSRNNLRLQILTCIPFSFLLVESLS